MLTTRKAFVLLLGGGVGLVGCNDQSSRGLTAPARPSVSAAVRADRTERDKNNQKVWGHARFIVTNEGNPEEWYIVDAKADKDAASNSLFTFAKGDLAFGAATRGGFVIHGEMHCFKIVGNRANLAARVEKSTNPNVHKGDYLTWRIEDNGSGERRPPDRTTQIFLANKVDAESFCAFGGDATHLFFPVKGNLEIKDR